MLIQTVLYSENHADSSDFLMVFNAIASCFYIQLLQWHILSQVWFNLLQTYEFVWEFVYFFTQPFCKLRLFFNPHSLLVFKIFYLCCGSPFWRSQNGTLCCKNIFFPPLSTHFFLFGSKKRSTVPLELEQNKILPG